MRTRITTLAMLLFMTVVALSVAGGAGAGASAAEPPRSHAGSSSAVTSRASAAGKIHIIGLLRDTRYTPPKPVPGVKITVKDDQGKVVGNATSSADGKFSVPLPGSAIDALGKTYVVEIDTKTLPTGTKLQNPKQVELHITIKLEQDYTTVFPIGPKPQGESTAAQSLQLLTNGLVFGLQLALAALGLSLVFGTTGLTNFAHGELVTFGAIVAFAFDANLGVPVIAAGVIATALSGVFGYVQDIALWRPLRKAGTGLIAMMIVSIGFGIFLRNLYQYLTDADNHNYTEYATVAPWHIGPVDLTPKSAAVAAVCIVVLVLVSLAVQRTRLGKATRAVSDNPALASSSGINVDNVITIVWVIGAALAGLAGFLLGLTQGFDYQLGFKILLLVFAATTLGGLGTIWGAMVGSIIIGLVVEESTLVIPSELKYVAGLSLLIVVLLIRPQGILGRRERIG